MRLVADLTRCVGAGQCVLTDAALFDQDDADGTVVLLVDVVPPAREAAAAEAAALCPGQALALVPDTADDAAGVERRATAGPAG